VLTMGYKYRNGSTPDHQTDVSDMDGVNNVADTVNATRDESMNSSQTNTTPQTQSSNSTDLSGIINGVKTVGGIVKDFVSAGGAKMGSAIASAVPKSGPFGPGGVIPPIKRP